MEYYNSLFICSDYWTNTETQIEAFSEDEAIEIFKNETGASVVKCRRIA